MEPRVLVRPMVSLRQKMLDRAWQLIVKREVDLLEVAYGVLMLGWGVQLILPWETFASAPGYRVLAQVMPEVAWGVLLIWVGVTKIGAYLLDQRRVRMMATIGAMMIWTFLSVAFGWANPYGTGIVVYPTLAFTSAVIFWRLYTNGGSTPG